MDIFFDNNPKADKIIKSYIHYASLLYIQLQASLTINQIEEANEVTEFIFRALKKQYLGI